jgi:hypothetical protein
MCLHNRLRELYTEVMKVREEMRDMPSYGDTGDHGSFGAAVYYLGEADINIKVAADAYDDAMRRGEVEEAGCR